MKFRFKTLSLFLALSLATAAFAGCGLQDVIIDQNNVDEENSYEVSKDFLKPDEVYASSNDNAIQGVTTKSNSSGGLNVNYNPTASSTNLVLESGNTAQYKIVNIFRNT